MPDATHRRLLLGAGGVLGATAGRPAVGRPGQQAADGSATSTGTGRRWSGYQGTTTNAGHAPGDRRPTGPVDVAWRRTFPDGVTSPPAIVDGTAYVATGDVHALDRITGEQQWSAPVDVTHSVTPVVADGAVYAAVSTVDRSSNHVYALRAGDWAAGPDGGVSGDWRPPLCTPSTAGRRHPL